jgi:hypothetical protein
MISSCGHGRRSILLILGLYKERKKAGYLPAHKRIGSGKQAGHPVVGSGNSNAKSVTSGVGKMDGWEDG